MPIFGRAVATALALSCAPLIAATPDDTQSISIRTADLNLASAEGAARLHSRLETAVRRACRATGNDLARQMEAAHCARMMRQDGTAKVALALQQARTGTQLADARAH